MHVRPHELAVLPYLFNLFLGLVLGCLTWYGLPMLLEPRHSGFYCEDDSIRQTFVGNTVSVSILMAGLFTISALTILTCECARARTFREFYNWKGYRMSQVLVNFFKYYAYSLLVFLLTLMLVIPCKYFVGRLRPYFIEVCQPLVEDPYCKNKSYVDLYVCEGTDAQGIKEARQAFFSGHASQSMAIAVFLAIYIHYRLPMNKYMILLRHLLQIGLIVAALTVGYTRVLDNQHHLSDVLVGFAVGAIIACLPWIYLGERRWVVTRPIGFDEDYPFIDESASDEDKRYKTSVTRLEPGELRVFGN